jgi:hypothetical protein
VNEQHTFWNNLRNVGLFVGFPLAVLGAGIFAYMASTQNAGSNPSPNVANPSYCSTVDRSRPRFQQYTQLGKDIQLLVDHCYDFQQNTMHLQRTDCAIFIPATDGSDDRISGKGFASGYIPTAIPADESFIGIHHAPCESPVISIDGAVVSGGRQVCRNRDFHCVDSVVRQIESTDARGHQFGKTLHQYAESVQRRYNHGVKRK